MHGHAYDNQSFCFYPNCAPKQGRFYKGQNQSYILVVVNIKFLSFRGLNIYNFYMRRRNIIECLRKTTKPAFSMQNVPKAERCQEVSHRSAR